MEIALPENAWSTAAKVVCHRISLACQAAGRPAGAVRLLPVTKTHPAAAAVWAAQAGYGAVGENRVQEAAPKRTEATPQAPALRWELIGHLQSNKAKLAVATFDRIQTLDSLALAERLNRLAGEAGKTLAVLLQVNTGNDAAKEGLAVGEAPALLENVLRLPHLRCEGLMTIGPLFEDPAATRAAARPAFAALRELAEDLRRRTGCPLPELSMGMSADLEEAIAEGSTLVRIGSAIFGARH